MQDKEDLLKHMVQLQGEREAVAEENELLKKNVAMLQVKVCAYVYAYIHSARTRVYACV